MFKKSAAIACLLLSSSHALAASHQIGYGLGGATIESNKDDDIGFGQTFNYAYQFHPNFSAEIGRMASKGVLTTALSTTLSDEEQSIEYNSTYLGLKANYYPVNFFNIYGIGGANYSELDRTIKNKNTGFSKKTSDDSIHAYFGAGAEFVLFQHVGIGLEYRRFMLAKDFQSDSVSAQVNYKF
ncbi:hypothetical protein BS333_16505 [Vibrio azureus]|uniref:Outer membrane protein beta-barrel domain-containing protein n=1 Tax=Vibrio azureus NBRC 104587 TaxID=1219077 RepID=U3AS47_9VIBR|nr:porin family protein [Vibrio azureus]AUI87984.1 hypothetical protein BS333_16505 [Vibrio azureus]GAD76082.1 hypothetical protein VAZ01S_036_00260 [Vibrio azureus NBRC 104587]